MVHPGSELAVELCGRELATPIMNAAGTLDLRGPTSDGAFGALIPKTVTASERRGNSPPVLKQLEQGWINAVGLKNPGLDVLLRNLDVYDVGLPIIVSIANYTPVGFAKMCKQLAEDPRVWAVELNLSCPNAGQGYTFCDNPYAVRSAVRAAKWALKGKPVFAKLGYEGVRENARVAVEAGAAALTLINTLPALHVDPTSRAVFAGGLSGPAIKPLALRAVYEVSRRVGVPVIGCGGATTGTDVAEFLIAGATAVQVGSATFGRSPREILEEYARYIAEHGSQEHSNTAADMVGMAWDPREERSP